MSLIYKLSTVRDLFEKLERDATSLRDEVTSDRMFNFVVTGYSMIDWINNDPSVPSSAKTASEIKSLHKDQWLKICGELANAAKHFTLKSRKPITSSAISSQGYGVGRFGKGGFGVGEEEIEIELNNGTKYGAFDLVNGVIDKWESFFLTHGI